MTTKHRLITDSFKVVKKARRAAKREKTPSPPPPERATHAGVADGPRFRCFDCGLPILNASYAEAERMREEELEKLRQFDLDWRFGPCTGISRLQRWERAKLHGLSPPEEIRYLLLQTHTDTEYNRSLWSDYPL